LGDKRLTAPIQIETEGGPAGGEGKRVQKVHPLLQVVGSTLKRGQKGARN